jgi:hypothetical protein
MTGILGSLVDEQIPLFERKKGFASPKSHRLAREASHK